MTTLNEVTSYLDSYLNHSAFQEKAVNGLQVESPNKNVGKVAYAVDAGLSIVDAAVKEGADLLLVHHGIFWGQAHPIRGAYAKKLELLFSNGCSLYASHLPLDAHPEVGNNVLLARFLGAEALEGFAHHAGHLIGTRGRFRESRTLDSIAARAEELPGFSGSLVLPFGKPKIETIAVVTGAGSFALQECAEAGIDLFVSGEPEQRCYHEAKELGINAIFAGHYATETLGVAAAAERLKDRLGVETIFIDEKTGI